MKTKTASKKATKVSNKTLSLARDIAFDLDQIDKPDYSAIVDIREKFVKMAEKRKDIPKELKTALGDAIACLSKAEQASDNLEYASENIESVVDDIEQEELEKEER